MKSIVPGFAPNIKASGKSIFEAFLTLSQIDHAASNTGIKAAKDMVMSNHVFTIKQKLAALSAQKNPDKLIGFQRGILQGFSELIATDQIERATKLYANLRGALSAEVIGIKEEDIARLIAIRDEAQAQAAAERLRAQEELADLGQRQAESRALSEAREWQRTTGQDLTPLREAAPDMNWRMVMRMVRFGDFEAAKQAKETYPDKALAIYVALSEQSGSPLLVDASRNMKVLMAGDEFEKTLARARGNSTEFEGVLRKAVLIREKETGTPAEAIVAKAAQINLGNISPLERQSLHKVMMLDRIGQHSFTEQLVNHAGEVAGPEAFVRLYRTYPDYFNDKALVHSASILHEEPFRSAALVRDLGHRLTPGMIDDFNAQVIWLESNLSNYEGSKRTQAETSLQECKQALAAHRAFDVK